MACTPVIWQAVFAQKCVTFQQFYAAVNSKVGGASCGLTHVLEFTPESGIKYSRNRCQLIAFIVSGTWTAERCSKSMPLTTFGASHSCAVCIKTSV